MTQSSKPDTHEIVSRALSFPFDDILKRYSKDYDINLEIAKEHEKELKRFLALAAIHPQRIYGMAGDVDKLWHTFLLFTKQYLQFSEEVAGRFLHHVPVGSKDDKEGDENAYLQMLSDYEEAFGEEAPGHIWPRPQKTFTVLGWD